MSMRHQAGYLTASYFPLKTPNAPTAVTGTMASGTSVSVAFTAPSDVGGGAISSYLVVSSGGQTASGSSSPIVVTGLTTDVAYTFVVYATNAFGTGPASANSNSVTPIAPGQQAYTTAGTYSWVAPAGVTSVSVVAVGGGGGSPATQGAGGGELRYKNNITVVPGNAYTVVVGAGGAFSQDGGASTFSTSVVIANGGSRGNGANTGGNGGVGDGGGNGGTGATPAGSYGSGGGAGGYSGAGGNGANNGSPQAGSGGGGGGGGSYQPSFNYLNATAGGGVGILGQGANGAAGSGGGSGGGGSGGTAGFIVGNYTYGGSYGGGAGAANNSVNQGGYGGGGAVRIIWPGTNRSFPSTDTGDL